MLAVLLTILKIIGIILISVLAFALLIILILLFVPFRYSIKGNKGEPADDISFRVSVTFLLHMLSGGISYEEAEFDRYGRVLGIRIWPRKKDKKESEDGDVYEYTMDMNEQPETSPPPGTEDIHTTETEQISDTDTDTVAEESTDNSYPENDKDSESIDDKDIESLDDKISKLLDSITSRYDSLSEKTVRIRKEIRFWDKMVHDDRNQNAVSFAKGILVRFLKKIAPRRIKGFIHFGTDDPATTGKILSYLAIFYPVLPRKLLIDPSFEDTLIYGNISIRGRIALITVGMALLRLYFNKDCKRLYRIYKRHKGDN